MVVYLHRFAQRTLQSHSVGSSSNVTKTLGSFALAAFTAGLVKKMGCKSARLQYMPALFLGCCFRKWNLNGPQMQEPTRGDLFISPSLFFFSSFFIATQQREQSCQNVCQENSVWEYREGSSAGSCMLFRVGQRRRAGSKTRLIAVLTEIHKRDRSYQA